MNKNTFTESEIKLLSKNKYALTVSTHGVTYSEEFKRIFITENKKGRPTREIFQECGFDVDILGQERIHSASKRWRRAFKKNGVDGLRDRRKDNVGRPDEKDLSLEEKFKRLQAHNQLLKAENELLKKLEMMERGLGKKKKK